MIYLIFFLVCLFAPVRSQVFGVGNEVLFFNVPLNFEKAEQICQTIEGHLVRMSDSWQHYDLVNTAAELGVNTFWIGVDARILGNNGTYENFRFTDRVKDGEEYFMKTTSPWQKGNVITQDCVRINENTYFEDDDCNRELPFFCRISDPFYPDKIILNNALDVSFSSAQFLCEYDKAELVRIENSAQNEYIVDLLRWENERDAWIGVDAEGKGGNGDPTRFSFTDGTRTGTEFFETKSEYPWDVNQPDNKYEEEDCVNVQADSGKWHDMNCYIVKPYICRRSRSPNTEKQTSEKDVILFGIGSGVLILTITSTIVLMFKFKTESNENNEQKHKNEKRISV